jgi:hypothetical protein
LSVHAISRVGINPTPTHSMILLFVVAGFIPAS